MKVGDLVRVKAISAHTLKALKRGSEVGIIIEHHKAEGNLLESVRVVWPDGSNEIDFPDWLEVVQKAP